MVDLPVQEKYLLLAGNLLEKALQGHHPESKEKMGRERDQKGNYMSGWKGELKGGSALGSLELVCS